MLEAPPAPVIEEPRSPARSPIWFAPRSNELVGSDAEAVVAPLPDWAEAPPMVVTEPEVSASMVSAETSDGAPAVPPSGATIPASVSRVVAVIATPKSIAEDDDTWSEPASVSTSVVSRAVMERSPKIPTVAPASSEAEVEVARIVTATAPPIDPSPPVDP